MHRLQQHILQHLILNSDLRYAELKPREIEGNLFMYHLKLLIREGLVEKNVAGRYQLTSKGKLYVDKLSLKSLTSRAQPRLVTLMAVENSDGQWLLYRRRRQPLINLIGFPYGKIHLGETVREAAERELREKTGLSADLTHYGDGYATVFEDGDPVSEIFFHMFYGCNPKGRLNIKSKMGQSFWGEPGSIEEGEIMPNMLDLHRLVRDYDGQRFFVELTHNIRSAKANLNV